MFSPSLPPSPNLSSVCHSSLRPCFSELASLNACAPVPPCSQYSNHRGCSWEVWHTSSPDPVGHATWILRMIKKFHPTIPHPKCKVQIYMTETNLCNSQNSSKFLCTIAACGFASRHFYSEQIICGTLLSSNHLGTNAHESIEQFQNKEECSFIH